MHRLTDLARSLNRSTVYLSGLQTRFELPVFPGAGYSRAYLSFLTTLVHLRTLAVPEETLRELWITEKKLLLLLHADTSVSPTWFLDSCGCESNPNRRLLLSNHDVGVDLNSDGVQLGLDFTDALPELFPGREMGEDVLRAFNAYRRQSADVIAKVTAELPHVNAAMRWAKSRVGPRKSSRYRVGN